MPTTYTPNLNLAKPARADTNWDALLNGNFDILDALPGLPKHVTVSLSSDQLINLSVTPVQLVPAPANGFMIVSVQTFFKIFPGSHPYGGGGYFSLFHGNQEFSSDHDGSHLAGAIVTETVPTLGMFSDFLGYNDGQTHVGGFGPISKGNAQALNLSGPDLNNGSLVTATVDPGNRGSGYAPGDTGTLTNTGDGAGTYTVLTVSGGAVQTVSVSGGNSYNTLDNPQATSPDTGNGDGGLQLNVTSIQKGNGTAKVEVYYLVVPTT